MNYTFQSYTDYKYKLSMVQKRPSGIAIESILI